MKQLNQILHGNCVEVLRDIPDGSIDLVVTSPPYDDIRDYSDGFLEQFGEPRTSFENEKSFVRAQRAFKKEKMQEKLKANNGYSFPFEKIATELYRVLAKGGTIVWVVGDAVTKGSESGSSFRQALFFQQLGFNIHDTMIYEKNGSSFPARRDGNRYSQVFEYMFVFTKGRPKTANLICDKKNKWSGWTTFGKKGTMRIKSGELVEKEQKPVPEYSPRNNFWKYSTGKNFTTKDGFAFEHPAMFPERLAEDHILTWSNEGDVVLDPFVGSGTTTKMAHINNRKWIGIEMSKEYVAISKERMKVAEEMKQAGYKRVIVSSARDTITSGGKMSHKEISSLKKKPMVELMLQMQEKLSEEDIIELRKKYAS